MSCLFRRGEAEREKALAQRRVNGVGPAYRWLLSREVSQDRRYRSMGRPRLLLEALQRGEAVEVAGWRLGPWRPPGCGPSDTVVLTPDM